MLSTASTVSNQQNRDWLHIIGIVLAILGLFVASYMAWAELTGNETSCPGHTGSLEGTATTLAVDCGFVQNSIYAKAFGMPVAILGVIGYLGILLVWLLENRYSLLGEYSALLNFGMALFGILFSVYLTYTELFIMYTVCTWCLTSAALMALVFIVTIIKLIQSLRIPA